MALTEKGEEIKKAMTAPESEGGYGKEKGEEVFYASAKKGVITGTGAADDDTENITLGGGNVGGLVATPFPERPVVNVEEGVGTTDAASGVAEVLKKMSDRGW